MKKLLILAQVTFLMTLPTTIMAEEAKSKFHDLFSGTYLSIGGGASVLQSKINLIAFQDDQYNQVRLKNKAAYKVSFGKAINNFRTELEFLYNQKETISESISLLLKSRVNISNYSYFLNAFYDFKNFDARVKPYVGLGVGLSRKSLSDQVFTHNNEESTRIFGKNSSKFAWNASLGLLFEVSENVALDFSYRYLDLGKIEGTQDAIIYSKRITTPYKNITGNIRNHTFLASVVIKF